MKISGSTSILFPLVASVGLAFFAVACGDDVGDPDAGADTGTPDATTTTDSGTPDAGRPDSGRPDSGPRDASNQAEYCVEGQVIESEGGDIDLGGEATTLATNSTGNRADLSCIDRDPPTVLNGNIRLEGCLLFAGTPPTRAELAAGLDVQVFYETDPNSGEPIDPSFDPETGLNRANTVGVTTELSDTAPQCASGLQLEIGAQAPGLYTDRVYTVRVRSSTVGGEWVTTYVQGVMARADVAGGGGCTPATCRYPFNMPLIRRSELQALITASGVNIPGSADLDDGQGPGYAFLAARDCTDSAMANAVMGFSAAPAAEGYLDANADLDETLVASSSLGIYAGLGFTITSSLGTSIYGGLGAQRFANECTEGFGLRQFRIFSDALSLVLFGRETVFH